MALDTMKSTSMSFADMRSFRQKCFSITIMTKRMILYQNEYKDSKFIELWNNVREVRNDLSHRSPEGFSVQIEEYQKMLISLDISLNKDGSVNWRKVSANEQVKSLYENKIAKSDDFKRYRYLLWLTNKPFDSIIEGLRNISKIVSDNL